MRRFLARMSQELKKMLDDKVLSIVRVENYSPDVMGFVQEDQHSKELITVEVKPEKITIKNISKAKTLCKFFWC